MKRKGASKKTKSLGGATARASEISHTIGMGDVGHEAKSKVGAHFRHR